MAYTNRQKADFYLAKWNTVQYNPTLLAIYWQLYKAYDQADKALKQLDLFNKRNTHLKRKT